MDLLDQDGEQKLNFAESLFTMAGAGSPQMKDGICIYMYSCNKSMDNNVFCNADGDMLIVPQIGTLFVNTEFGKLKVSPHEILVMPRGIRYSIDISESSRGWICEIYKGHFRLPELGPIGANGLANIRDFKAPKADYKEQEGNFMIYQKFCGKMFECEKFHTPFDVVAWHGSYYPYKYNLDDFSTINAVSFDHPDPSIFTVLTVPTDEPGTALCDFVIFPPRWMVQENTFRPPYYHRNTMSEFMGNIYGAYDAKGAGFGPGCSSLHSTMTPHGPDYKAFEGASNAELKPVKQIDTCSFMFETCYLVKLYKKALGECITVDEDYYKCWSGLESHFNKDNK